MRLIAPRLAVAWKTDRFARLGPGDGMRRFALFVGIVSAATGAQAGDKPIYAAAPAWVKPAPAIDTSRLGDDAPVVLLLDTQQRLENGQSWNYVDSATRAASTQVLGAIGTIQIPWQPAHGDLIIHRVEIIRGTEHIDLLKGGAPFQILRREPGMEQRALDGMLTATLPVAGLRVGDVLHMTVSTTSKDPTLKGNVQTMAPLLLDPFRVQFARLRLSWPKGSDIRWKSYAAGISAQPVIEDGYNVLTVPLPLPKPAEMPQDAPTRFQSLPLFEATSFSSWASVAAVMAPLYATDGLIADGSPLAGEVARIAAAEADPLKRAALALQLVQDKVRYQLMGMDTGNYVPQAPAQTWSLRYGDCKAKTVLLLAILHKLGIEAEPVLANSRLGDLVPTRLPGAAAFDHVFVRATIADETLWLDGTRAGDRLADIHDTPPFGAVLPLRAAGATLIPIAMRPNARPSVQTVVDLDESAGVGLPALVRLSMVVRGGTAEMVRLAAAQASKDDLGTMTENAIKPIIGTVTLSSHALHFDDAAGTATIEATGIVYPNWNKRDERWGTALDTSVADLKFAPDRARAAWRDIPVATGAPDTVGITRRVVLPNHGDGFTLEGDPALAVEFGATKVDRTVTRAGERVTIDTRMSTNGTEVPVTAIPDVRRRLAQAQARGVRAVAPGSYPPFWMDVEAAKRGHRFDALLAAYRDRIDSEPKVAKGYTDRAWFLGRILERRQAIADLDRALAIEPDVDTYISRSGFYEALGEKAKAKADAVAAHTLDPASTAATGLLARLQADGGDRVGALALVQERIDAGGDDQTDFLAAKADIEADGGDKEAALATLDAAIASHPGKPDLLNNRCWLKGTRNIALDTALKDCTKSIELSDDPDAALDSRAMVYFRLNRMDDALADLDAALAGDPDLASSMYLRGVVRKRTGDAKGSATDLLAARMLSPQIDANFGKYGIVP